MELTQAISGGIQELGLDVTKEQLQQFERIIEQLIKWNKAYNLTAIRDPQQMIITHLLDSLAIAPFMAQGRLLDIGTGPGFPGIPLAIYEPKRDYSLLDSNGKKTRYLKQLVYDMSLSQVSVVDTRVEEWQPDTLFDVIVSRAFASLEKMVSLSHHLLAETGVWQAMKGEYPEQELAALPDYVELVKVDVISVPKLNAERHLVTLRKKASS
ncbi:16S rRNA (guanine(527)-N(7))-methyltransferase RsmG [Pleionea sp. CnH1-48]|uniref:16S rRNA (guanine(527)-N(7))-methyltransferase RsmG n=1 Tax=Pleionea sp. CnH1-48 TaxID=2954494 RepID=UPI0020979D67|nr:16S rRNA (guanine(527)-N(7))-methyltransferase RsmG [Pleionea sp. CnH1-48]MCO7226613.1 16S rRNA (guanine(527)-N(7))-methyltransferase RsmG [Pleionea sp. CnH1-48]